MVEVYGLDIDKLDNGLLRANQEELTGYFSDYRRNKIVQCKNEKAKRQSIAAGYLLDLVLSLHGLREKTAEFVENPYGKRMLSGADVNLSHSGHYVLCAYAASSVGIDIEQMRPDMENVAKRFFAKTEYDWLLKQENRKEAFSRLWTLKESYVKQIGTGLKMPLSQFEIKIGQEICVCAVDRKRKMGPHFKEYVVEDYCIAVCAEEQEFSEEIIFLA